MDLERYGLIGDLHTAALVGAHGSVDWLCLPRFDSAACFAALLGREENGCWSLAPADPKARSGQSYRDDTLILETRFDTGAGAVRVIDFMPPDGDIRELVRIVEGIEGTVAMKLRLVLRLNYGLTIPWVQRAPGGIRAVGGPDALVLKSDVRLRGEGFATVAEFKVARGQRKAFVLSWHPSNEPAPPVSDPHEALRRTERYWKKWVGHCTYRGEWRPAMIRSLITLKALTYDPTGGILAAPTTSLPEKLGGIRNWDYRYCWVRDATLSLRAFMSAGYREEARAWTRWLLRAVGGDPSQLQIMYGAAGESRLTEVELPHLAGYAKSRPVRIGNAASTQFQLDVYGELLGSMHLARTVGLKTGADSWQLERHLVEFVAKNWMKPDEGIWEIRGPRRHFTHSKMMAWVAVDRAVKAVEDFGLVGDLKRWRRLRQTIHDDVCQKGFHAARGVFTQYYGSTQLDASLLLMPLVGFLPATDPRVIATINAINRDLVTDGLVYRYHPRKSTHVDGLPPGEGTFLPCSFWLVNCLHLLGRDREARELFDRLLGLRSPLGLLAEEYDPHAKRLVGNFPQAFSHVGLINSILRLTQPLSPANAANSSGRRAKGGRLHLPRRRSGRTGRRARG